MSNDDNGPVIVLKTLLLCLFAAILVIGMFESGHRNYEVRNGPIPVAIGNTVRPRVVWASPGDRVHTLVNTQQDAGEGRLYLVRADGTRHRQLWVNNRWKAQRFGPSEDGLISNGHLSVDVPIDAQQGDRVVLELSILEDLHSTKVLEVQSYHLAVVR